MLYKLLKIPHVVPDLVRFSAIQSTFHCKHLYKFSFTRSFHRTCTMPQNRLHLEKSPYLLQHANNPVDWYPWGQEAFDKAKSENKIIFLSVGYSTCHWCHVMERESFENEEIGQLLSKKFVCIKVDREERPDVDKIYMAFVQVTTGSGGWPMSVWLTPELKPIVGGTYFPPENKFGQPGLKSIVHQIDAKWRADSEGMKKQGNKIITMLKSALEAEPSYLRNPNADSITKCFSSISKSYDYKYGGFGRAPKFPQPVIINFLLRFHSRNPTSRTGKSALDMCVNTLKMMSRGGIYDHVAKGFHRYSTDGEWHVPHFEKMLYDQSQLISSYVMAYQITEDESLRETAEEIIDYVHTNLSNKHGGFYSAEDADSLPTSDATAKREGAFCVWTYKDVESLLKDDKVSPDSDVSLFDVVSYHYNIQPNGNVNPKNDPHEELKKQNVLIIKGSEEKTAQKYNITIDQLKLGLKTAKEKLSAVRAERPPPHRDDKMLTSWNALMVGALAQAGRILKKPVYTERAVKAANFLRTHMYDKQSEVLLRSAYRAEDDSIVQISPAIKAFSDDYAFLIRALIELYQTTFDEQWLSWATSLQTKMNELFWDETDGAFFTSRAGESDLVMRLKEDQDGAEPSANSISASNLLFLASALDRPAWAEKASGIFKCFNQRLIELPMAMPEMLSSLDLQLSSVSQIIIVGDHKVKETQDLIECAQASFNPSRLVLCVTEPKESFLYKHLKVLENLKQVDNKPTAYVCQNNSCSLPLNNVSDLIKLLEGDNTTDQPPT